MSTPREHYLEAERLLRSVNQAMRDAHAQGGSEATIAEIGRQLTATAHVHALLALVTGEPTEPVYSIALEPDGPLRHVRLSQDDTDGGWVTECLDVPGAMGQGETPEKAIENLGSAVAEILARGWGDR